jgi:hypothetical protein
MVVCRLSSNDFGWDWDANEIVIEYLLGYLKYKRPRCSRWVYTRLLIVEIARAHPNVYYHFLIINKVSLSVFSNYFVSYNKNQHLDNDQNPGF